MIKKDIIEALYQSHGGMSRDEVEKYTNDFIDLLGDAVVRNENVTITHFGRFKHKQRSVREVSMPSGEKRLSAAGQRIQFVASPTLKTFLNSDEESE